MGSLDNDTMSCGPLKNILQQSSTVNFLADITLLDIDILYQLSK